ncbi:hypothetical protein ACIRQP_14950 [Streptomyces sp. NPDC102274]|uniref:hypothetical protein n=1 Tax=Streptomyces sp. NPDC102274 TaxID=3366151 RepID=UPI00381F6CB0
MHTRTRIRTAILATTAAALLPLTAACSSSEQGTAERGVAPQQSVTGDAAPAEEPIEEKAPDTELAVGDGFRYKDGVLLAVTGINRLTAADFGEFDLKPGADKTGFRVSLDVTNNAKNPLDLDAWGVNAQGATTGGQTEFVSAEKGSRQMTGRLAPGKKGSFTFEYALAKKDGAEVVFTMTRVDDSVDLLAEDPHWTGTIK